MGELRSCVDATIRQNGIGSLDARAKQVRPSRTYMLRSVSAKGQDKLFPDHWALRQKGVWGRTHDCVGVMAHALPCKRMVGYKYRARFRSGPDVRSVPS